MVMSERSFANKGPYFKQNVRPKYADEDEDEDDDEEEDDDDDDDDDDGSGGNDDEEKARNKVGEGKTAQSGKRRKAAGNQGIGDGREATEGEGNGVHQGLTILRQPVLGELWALPESYTRAPYTRR
ncbi:hypothetical protein PUN28_017063 [Cardiocondyla obscurior]|uniref:Uncharacterized protein n=1 Tax=Cardiocondyla obscurior TaxID=286306 RepID=A0AAW2EMG2_9HYME